MKVDCKLQRITFGVTGIAVILNSSRRSTIGRPNKDLSQTMAAPLRSANPGQQKSVQFAHFGVLDAGAQSKASTVTSLALNVVIACVVIIISMASAKRTIEHNKLLTNLVAPIVEKKPEPIKPKVIPPQATARCPSALPKSSRPK